MLQLNQLGNPEDEENMPEIYYWARFFKATTWEEIQMLAQKNENIQKSILTLKELTADEKAKMQMEARERYRRDMASALDFGKEQGIEQSKQEIQALKDNLQQSHIENVKLQSENEKMLAESAKLHSENEKMLAESAKLQMEKEKIQAEMSERIRFLEEQLEKAKKQ